MLTLPSIDRRINKLFAIFLGAAAFWSFTSFMLHLNAFPQQALLWNELLTTALFWTLIAYYHFIRVYANRPAGIPVYTGYALVLILGGLSLSGNIVKYAYVIDGVLHHDLGISIYIIGAVGIGFFGDGLRLLIKKYRNSVDPTDRNRTTYLIAGWAVMVMLGASNLIMTPTVAGLPLDHMGSLSNALIISYAILKYQLVDFRVLARQMLAYFLVTIGLGGIYAGVVLVGYSLMPALPLYSVLLLASGLALLLAFLARPLRFALQERIDRLFYRGTYEYRQTLLHFTSRMGNIINLNELADEILPTVSLALGTPQAKLLFEDASSGDFITQFTYPKSKGRPSNEIRFNSDSPAVAWLQREAGPLDLKQIDNIPLFKGLWEQERERLSHSDLELLCPIKSRGTLIGILALGRKQSRSLYSQDDIQLVVSLASQAGVIIENARVLDSLKSQQRQVEQLLNEIVLAQEDERQRISVDLHDSVAQWLVAASYRVQACKHLLFGNGNDKALTELTDMESTITKSLKELRRVVIGLRPPALDELGLTHALQQSLEELKADGTDCKFSQIGEPLRLPSNVEIAVYRIVQEAMTNIHKHANASKVSLRLQFQDDKLQVEIKDNGNGFDLPQTLDSAISVGHVGLVGMKQRAEMLGGYVQIRSREGSGATVTISLPILAEEEEQVGYYQNSSG
jgi:signal transduction histidine kinase